MPRHTLTANVDDRDFEQAVELCAYLDASRNEMLRRLINSAYKELISEPRKARLAAAKASGGDAAVAEVRAAIASEVRAAHARPVAEPFHSRARRPRTNDY